MPRYAANLSLMFAEHALKERFAAAARADFRAVEVQFPYALSREDYAAASRDAGLPVALINLDRGDPAKTAGFAAVPGAEATFRETLQQALDYAAVSDTPILHAMAGYCTDPAARAEARKTYIANLRHAGEVAGRHGRTIVIEAINPFDMPGYFLNRTDEAAEILREIGSPHVKMLFDVYHTQIVEGDIFRRMERHMPLIGHVQIAAVPSRHEPDEGEIDFAHVLAKLIELGYAGDIGCEYRPRGVTEAGLGWRRTLAARMGGVSIL
jgi:hydroxypyruvate isomerase